MAKLTEADFPRFVLDIAHTMYGGHYCINDLIEIEERYHTGKLYYDFEDHEYFTLETCREMDKCPNQLKQWQEACGKSWFPVTTTQENQSEPSIIKNGIKWLKKLLGV